MRRKSDGVAPRRGWIIAIAVVACLGVLPAAMHAPLALSSPHGGSLAPTAPHFVTAFAATPRVPAGAAPSASSLASLEWTTATIFYGASDPSGYLFGQGSVMAVDNGIQNTTSFGGEAVAGLSNITLVWNNGTVGYWSYAASLTDPSPRENSSFQSYEPGGLAVLFGGLVNLHTQETTNDTWVYWFVNQTWENLSARLSPPARENAAFAIDPTDGVGLLEGGIDPDYVNGHSTGSVLWNDTWQINLTTLNWTPVAATGSPPPMFGASMVWDPILARFVLFGGCDASGCTNDVWTYAPGSAHWNLTGPTGTVPTGRGSASFVWDPFDNVTLLFGGFTTGATGFTALGDTYALSSAATSWSAIGATGGPPPTYDAASAFSDYPGCRGMWVQGGSPALTGVVYNDYLLAPVSEPPPNCFTPIGGSTGGGPPAKCSNASALVTIQVLDAASGTGLPGSNVEISGSCGQSAGVTGAAGFLNLSDAAPDLLTVTAAHADFHGGFTNATLTGRPGQVIRLSLVPLPELHAHVVGVSSAGTATLVGATVAAGAILVGNSSATGWVNTSAPPSLNGSLTVSASAVDYSTAATTIVLPYTGAIYANLSLQAYGPIEVRIVDGLTGAPLAHVPARLGFVDPLGANSTLFMTDSHGWYNASLRAGNYSVSEAIPGYFANQTGTPVYHGWIQPTVIVVGAVPQYGADVQVRVLNGVLGTPVPNATVTFGGSTEVLDDGAGWANATDVGPPGFLNVSASAPGFYPNATTVTIEPYLVLAFVIHLAPAPPCSAFAACPPAISPPAKLVAFSFLPPPGLARDILLLSPALLVLAGAAYVLTWRRAGPSPVGGSRAVAPVGEPRRGL
ncbi:MAG: hypothetical protein L3K17_03875 [Thermoplasmata archaeon]|nr:hypothetical protein [Thermoplasmata archaeon]